MPIYNIERVILQTQTQFGDKAHIVYVNGTYRDEDPVGELMSDFHCSDYREMKIKTLANMVQYYKEDPKGVDKMCELMDRIAESRAVEVRIESALTMIGELLGHRMAEHPKFPLNTDHSISAPLRISPHYTIRIAQADPLQTIHLTVMP